MVAMKMFDNLFLFFLSKTCKLQRFIMNEYIDFHVSMKAVFVKKEGGIEIRDVDVPKIHEGELLVKMRACGIDGTDLEKAFWKTCYTAHARAPSRW